jgi:hypothetical protein
VKLTLLLRNAGVVLTLSNELSPFKTPKSSDIVIEVLPLISFAGIVTESVINKLLPVVVPSE